MNRQEQQSPQFAPKANGFQKVNISMIKLTKEYYLQELLGLQNNLNQQLILNGMLMDRYIKETKKRKQKTSGSQASTNPSNLGKNEENFVSGSGGDKKSQYSKVSKKSQQSHRSKRSKKSQSQYEPQQEVSGNQGNYKLSETKNVPKNYGKSIMTFISKCPDFLRKTLKHYNVDSEKFQIYMNRYKGKINTIAQLRSLWLQQQNPYAKVLRIISAQYMRKHCLSHIFNSRVENHSKHVKYRYKIMSALESPQEFTQIKDF